MGTSCKLTPSCIAPVAGRALSFRTTWPSKKKDSWKRLRQPMFSLRWSGLASSALTPLKPLVTGCGGMKYYQQKRKIKGSDHLSQLDILKSMTLDGMHLWLLREVASVNERPLPIIFYQVTMIGEVPDCWGKKTNVMFIMRNTRGRIQETASQSNPRHQKKQVLLSTCRMTGEGPSRLYEEKKRILRFCEDQK